MSEDEGKQVTGTSMGPVSCQTHGQGTALANLPQWVEPRGQGVTQNPVQGSGGVAEEVEWHQRYKGETATGLG